MSAAAWTKRNQIYGSKTRLRLLSGALEHKSDLKYICGVVAYFFKRDRDVALGSKIVDFVRLDLLDDTDEVCRVC